MTQILTGAGSALLTFMGTRSGLWDYLAERHRWKRVTELHKAGVREATLLRIVGAVRAPRGDA